MAADMDSTIDTLKALLDSPCAAEKLESLLGAFSGGFDAHSTSDKAPDESLKPSSKKDSVYADDIPIESVMKIAKAYKSINKSGDPRVNLLKAIKPYVRNSRSESVDTAIKLLGLLRLAPLLGDFKDVL